MVTKEPASRSPLWDVTQEQYLARQRNTDKLLEIVDSLGAFSEGEFESLEDVVTALVEQIPTIGTPQATTSGTEFDFTIPSWATQVSLSLINCTLSGTDDFLIQLGDAGGIEISGYLGSSITTTYTAGFGIRTANAAAMVHGQVLLTLVNSGTFTWSASGSLSRSDTGVAITTGGSKSLSAVLTTVRLTRTGTNTFDSADGWANVRYS